MQAIGIRKPEVPARSFASQDGIMTEMEATSRILEFLYLGSAHSSANKDKLTSLSIDHIVNVTATNPNHFPLDFRYMNVKLLDADHEDISKHFDAVFAFIEEARKKGCAVLVHCAAGMSRSSTIVIAYLMKHHNMSLKSAYAFTKARRPIVSPNPGFMRQLVRYERVLFGKNTLDSNDYERNRFQPKFWNAPKTSFLHSYRLSRIR
eukprot:GILK01006228.1.p1 GENE.GILK01006228.1~~GILK01006228.1.p1  ORF type:complete len:206 (-),score=9.03 GILK01006228.1:186-803(-)